MLMTLDLPTELQRKLQTLAELQRIPLNKYVEQTIIKTFHYEQIVESINQLPDYTLPELLNFIKYLHFKTRQAQICQAIAERDKATLRELAAPSLLTLMDELSQQAQANGLTPEILESILNEQ